MKNRIIVSVIALYLASCSVWSPTFPDTGHVHDHEHDHEHGHGENGSSVGKPGDSIYVSLIIVLQMTFNRFKPSKINVERDETIKFIFKNTSEKNTSL